MPICVHAHTMSPLSYMLPHYGCATTALRHALLLGDMSGCFLLMHCAYFQMRINILANRCFSSSQMQALLVITVSILVLLRRFVSTGRDVTVNNSYNRSSVPCVLCLKLFSLLKCGELQAASSAAHIMQVASKMMQKNKTGNSFSNSPALGFTKEALVHLCLSSGIILVEVS